MARGPCTFKQQDVKRVLLAARAAGVSVTRIRVSKDGTIELDTGNQESIVPEIGEGDDQWDAALK